MTVAPVETASPPQTLPEIPFPGLDWFTAEYAPFFFGRESDCKVIASNLEAARLTLLYGASGVGKSSVLLAGVVRTLRLRALENLDRQRRRYEEAGRSADRHVAKFAISDFRSWIDDPLPPVMEHIRLAAMEALGGEALDPWQPGEDPVARLREWTRRVRFLYVVLDQFEEYFLYHARSNEPGSFDVELARVLNEPGLHVHFLISLREDALALLDRFKSTIPGLYDNYLRVDHLDLRQADQAIRGPVEAYNALRGGDFAVDDELVRKLLDSPELRAHRALGADTTALFAANDDAKPRLETPYLQLVLRRLWLTERDRGSSRLQAKTLDALGGPRQIVKGHLEMAMAALEPGEQDIAVEIFHHLVTPSKSKVAHAAADLADYVKQPESEVTLVLDKLCAGNRILRRIIAPPEADGSEQPARYEIFHDVLAEPILTWRAQKLAERAERDQRFAKERELEQQIADEQAKRHRAQARTRRLAVAAAGVLVLLITVASIVFNIQSVAARHTSRSQELAAAAIAQAESDPQAALGTALEALRVKKTPAASAALLTILSESRLRSIVPSPGWLWGAAIGGPNGRYVALGGVNGGGVRVWDWRRKRELAHLDVGDTISAMNVADGGKLLLTLGTEVKIWRLADCVGKATCQPQQGWTGRSTSAAISDDGRWVVTGSTFEAELWNAAACRDGKCAAQKLPGSSGVEWVAVQGAETSGRALVAAANADRTVLVWSRSSNGRYRVVRRFVTPWSQLGGVAISPDAKLLAAFGDKTVVVWDLTECASSTVCHTLLKARHPDFVQAIAFAPDSASLATVSEDGIARVWNLLQPTPPLDLRGLHGIALSIGFSADGKYLVTGGDDREARVWSVVGGRVVAKAATWYTTAAFDPAGRQIDVATSTGLVAVRDRAGRLIKRVRLQTAAGGVGVTFSHSRQVIAASYPDGRTDIRNLRTCGLGGACVVKVGPPPRGWVSGLAFSGDDALLATADGWDGVRVIQGRSGRVLARLAGLGLVMGVTFTRHRPLLATASGDGTIRIWNVSACERARRCVPRLVRTVHAATLVMALAFSPDDRRLAVGGADGVGRVWSWEDPNAKPLELVGHTSNIRAVAFSADGRRIVTGGADATVRIWDADSGAALGILRNHTDKVESVDFDPRNSSIVLSASDDGTVRTSRCETCGPHPGVRAVAERVERQVTRAARWLPTDRQGGRSGARG